MAGRIHNLTLEVIYLLTGEDYELVKTRSGKILPHNSSTVDPSPIMEPPPPSLTSERNNKKQILEVTQKIVELLTGEVPIRCQDVIVYFSMEEWEYLEGHKDLYKDVMMENWPPPTTPGKRRL
ncbi:unnamed protein product [Staurois parvus]|uniref:KRAB domain-containing protein n=1 Tax=Staurois parvus TaxID=386267 RepID=A0ABN9DXT5_9NEOB|nr:unnamed protein product [Staurois parvus]